jgi:hypothetical protein
MVVRGSEADDIKNGFCGGRGQVSVRGVVVSGGKLMWRAYTCVHVEVNMASFANNDLENMIVVKAYNTR